VIGLGGKVDQVRWWGRWGWVGWDMLLEEKRGKRRRGKM